MFLFNEIRTPVVRCIFPQAIFTFLVVWIRKKKQFGIFLSVCKRIYEEKVGVQKGKGAKLMKVFHSFVDFLFLFFIPIFKHIKKVFPSFWKEKSCCCTCCNAVIFVIVEFSYNIERFIIHSFSFQRVTLQRMELWPKWRPLFKIAWIIYWN